jgi:hypothetical protein
MVACGIGLIDFDANRGLPKHDLADIEVEQPLAGAGTAGLASRACAREMIDTQTIQLALDRGRITRCAAGKTAAAGGNGQ